MGRLLVFLKNPIKIERFFGNLKERRHLATRYDKGFSHLFIWLQFFLGFSYSTRSSGCCDLFEIAVRKMGYPNLSYINDMWFDGAIINNIHDYLIVECDLSEPDRNGICRSPDDFCCGSKDIILALRSRFIRERSDALEILI